MTKILTAIVTVLVSTVVTLTASVVLAMPAQAASNCVDYGEFSTVPFGHRTAVENYWGTGPGRSPGNTTWANPNLYNVTYPACAGDGYWVSVGYRRTTNQAIGIIGFFPHA